MGRRHVTLRRDHVPANRDFQLTWQPAAGPSPAALIYREQQARQYLRPLDGRSPCVERDGDDSAARNDLRYRHVRLDGWHLDRTGQGSPPACTWPAHLAGPVQCDPIQQHHTPIVLGAAGRQNGCSRQGRPVCRAPSCQRRHGNSSRHENGVKVALRRPICGK